MFSAPAPRHEGKAVVIEKRLSGAEDVVPLGFDVGRIELRITQSGDEPEARSHHVLRAEHIRAGAPAVQSAVEFGDLVTELISAFPLPQIAVERGRIGCPVGIAAQKRHVNGRSRGLIRADGRRG